MPGVSATVRVVLAEDHAMLRGGVRAMLEAAGGVEVIGEASDGREAVKLAERLRPDVIVMDVAMPQLNGIEATRQIHAASPKIAIIILSMYGDREYIREALRAGASAYLLKEAAFSELWTAIREVVAGRRYLSPAVSGVVLDDYIDRARSDSAPSALDKLTSREREVLQLIAESKTSGEIGKALSISAHTVDSHRRKIMEKLAIHRMVDLVKFALRHGLTSLE
ncbi:MAG: response regulator transcription factor [Byssovorax sp.]